jgi:HAD superfamily hydrolase (TIGR01509 family)
VAGRLGKSIFSDETWLSSAVSRKGNFVLSVNKNKPRTNRINLIIFDCDGVLVDSEVIAQRVYAEYLTSLGLPHTPEECNARYLGVSDATVVTMFADQGVTLPPTFIEDVHRLEHDALFRDLEPHPGIKDALGSIGLPVCVASSGVPAKITSSLSKTGLLDHFMPNLFSATQVENGKPSPDLFLFAAEQMKIPPESALVIEDSPAGVRAGVAAGMTVVGFTGGSHIQAGHGATLRALGARYILDDMRGLPGFLKAAQ